MVFLMIRKEPTMWYYISKKLIILSDSQQNILLYHGLVPGVCFYWFQQISIWNIKGFFINENLLRYCSFSLILSQMQFVLLVEILKISFRTFNILYLVTICFHPRSTYLWMKVHIIMMFDKAALILFIHSLVKCQSKTICFIFIDSDECIQ